MTLAIIPARYGSSRFPGKPLAMLGDRPVIQWVYENAVAVADRVVVATDDERIAFVVRDFGGEAVITSKDHSSGTSRVWEAYRIIGASADLVLNLQGDEPFIKPEVIKRLISCMEDPDEELATIVTPFTHDISYDDLADPNCVKVVADAAGYAVYFSRSVIPYVRDLPKEKWPEIGNYLCHIGAYAFRPDVLKRVVEMPQSQLEHLERLEQLTWIFNGIRIRLADVKCESLSIDTPADLEKAELLMKKERKNVD